MSFYRRRLPHWQPQGAPIFLTWRLYGSLPYRIAAPDSASTDGERFLAIDREMDRASSGPTWLKDPRIASCFVDTLLLAEKKWELYRLFAWVVMSNHVHVLLKPRKPVREVTRAVKNTSAREANIILDRRGTRFWQDESYDHWVRDGKEFDRIVRYIEWNPVRAGLVESVEQWAWSSASPRYQTWQVGDLPHGPA
jgi:REP-associated tyrosine transposase